jgi:hypothetical protein
MRMVLRNDEKLRGPSYRNKGVHITKKEKLGRRSLCCSILNLYCKQLTERIPETSRGILNVDRMSQPDQE